MSFESVTWQNLINCVYNPLSFLLYKNAGVEWDWDAGAFSTQKILAAGVGLGVRFCRSYDATLCIVCGLTFNDSSPGYEP